MENQVVGRYQLENLMGRGGMATVYRAYDPKFERYVALKMLYEHSPLDDETSRQKFAQEARLIASLEHHSIVPVYDYGEHEGRPYLVMRLMTGGTLNDRLKHGALPLEMIGRIMDRICSALDKAHVNHVVHRDIKPGNILFDDDGMPYLADFGIARLVDGTQTTTLLGSPHYMAPEQAQGFPLSSRTDVYQMGVVLFRMLTGRTPFSADSTEAVLYQHVHMDVPLLREVAPQLPPRLDGVLGFALAKRPEERYQRAGELAASYTHAAGLSTEYSGYISSTQGDMTDQLPPTVYPPVEATAVQDSPDYDYEIAFAETSLADDAIDSYKQEAAAELYDEYDDDYVAEAAAMPEPEPVPAEKPQLRWGLIIGLVIGGLGLLACGAGLWQFDTILAMILPEPPEPVTITVPTRVVTPEPGETGVETAVETEEPLLVPTVTLASDTPANGEPVIARTAAELQSLGGGRGQIAYVAERNGNFDIYVMNEDGSETRLTTHFDDDFRPVWSPDGSQIAYHSLRDTWEIFTIRPDGTGEFNVSRHPADDSFPQWSPDSTQLAFHSNRNQKFDIFVVNADGTDLRQLTNTDEDDFGPMWSPDGSEIVFHRRISGQRQIALMNADGSNVRIVTSVAGEAVFPQWSPDGTRIAFYSDKDDGWNLYTMNPDGSDMRRITVDDSPDYYVTWSENGEWLIYHSYISNDNRDLFMTDVNGLQTIRLTDTTEQERMPNWRP